MRLPIIVNQSAGSTANASVRAWIDSVSQACTDPGAEWCGYTPALHLVPPKDINNTVDRAIADGARRIAVGGGDGTLGSVLPAVTENAVELVCLPFGTHNHFVKDLGLPLTPDAWTELCTGATVDSVDLGEVSGQLFLNNVSIGLYPRMVSARSQLPRERLLGSKRLASMYAFLRIGLRRPPSLRLSVVVEPSSETREQPATADDIHTKAIFIGNNEYADQTLAPMSRRRLNKGVLSLFAPRSTALMDLAVMAGFALRGEVAACPNVDHWLSESVQLEFAGRHRGGVKVAVDGELVRLRSPIPLRIRPAALKVVVP